MTSALAVTEWQAALGLTTESLRGKDWDILDFTFCHLADAFVQGDLQSGSLITTEEEPKELTNKNYDCY